MHLFFCFEATLMIRTRVRIISVAFLSVFLKSYNKSANAGTH